MSQKSFIEIGLSLRSIGCGLYFLRDFNRLSISLIVISFAINFDVISTDRETESGISWFEFYFCK